MKAKLDLHVPTMVINTMQFELGNESLRLKNISGEGGMDPKPPPQHTHKEGALDIYNNFSVN